MSVEDALARLSVSSIRIVQKESAPSADEPRAPDAGARDEPRAASSPAPPPSPMMALAVQARTLGSMLG